jgi:hypothetical protein
LGVALEKMPIAKQLVILDAKVLQVSSNGIGARAMVPLNGNLSHFGGALEKLLKGLIVDLKLVAASRYAPGDN